MNRQMNVLVSHRVAQSEGVHHWPIAGVVWVAVLLGLLGLYWQTGASITAIWVRSETYTHGFLILPISAYLIWRRRAELAQCLPWPQWWGLVAVAGLVLVWLVGEAADILGVKQVAVVGLIPAVTWTLLGTAVVRAIAFPLAFLVFAVPWGQFLVPPLQDFTAAFSVWMLELTGIPVFWEGRMISIPVGDFEVAEACSGIRYLIASLALGCLYAYIFYRSNWKRLAFVGMALLVPIIANGLRAYGIIMLAHLSNMRLATGIDHLLYGWVFFGIVMGILFWLGSFWAEHPEPSPGSPTLSGSGGGAASSALFAAAALVIGLGGAGPVAAHLTDELQRGVATSVVLPSAANGWEGPLAPENRWEPGFRGADVTRHRVYQEEGRAEQVHVLVIHYRRERQGAELVNDRNRLYGDRWRLVAVSTRKVAASPKVQLEIRELRLAAGEQNRVVWSWYDVGGWVTPRPIMAKGFAAMNRLLAQPGDATLVALAANYPLQPEQARSRIRTFLAEHPGLAGPRGMVEVER